jgi:hypothetical protein
MRWAKSYSIVDHQLLHGGYLQRLSHAALALYLFLVVVGDRGGRSFYSEASVMEILRLSQEALASARLQLIAEGLIEYRRPYWWVKTLCPESGPKRQPPQAAIAEVSPTDRETSRRHLAAIIEMLSKKEASSS